MGSNCDVTIGQNHFAGVASFLAGGDEVGYFLNRPRISQLSLQKFQSLYGSLGTGVRLFETVINNGRCWDQGNLSKVLLSSLHLFKSSLAKARLGLVPVFQSPQKKLGASLKLYKREKFSLSDHSVRHSPSGLCNYSLSQCAGS